MVEWLEPVRDALAPRYQVQRVLGRGGMGTVFLATDTRLNCPVAIKVLPPQLAGEAAMLRFLREARLLAALKHPHIVAIHDVDERDGFAYYVMDHLADRTLADRLRHGPLPKQEVLKVGRDLLDALERVHEAAVVHRDVKPSNVFLVEGRAVLTDFGIAKAHDPNLDTLTAPHHQPHTPGYAAPEQIAGVDVDGRTDLFAVGLTLFECYTGTTGRQGPGRPPWHLVPRPVRPVLRRALEVDPDRRWPDARSFRHQLWRTRVRSYLIRAGALTAGGIAIGIIGGTFVGNRDSSPIASWAVTVAGPSSPALDSISDILERGLRGSVAYTCGPGDCPEFPYRFTLGGRQQGEQLVAELVGRDSRREGDPILAQSAAGAPTEWRSLADSLLTSTLPILWAEQSAVRDWVPWRVLPSNPSALEALAGAEAQLAMARWSEALRAYQRAVQIDTTCILCSWRITEVERWHVRPPSSEHIERALRAVDRFPQPFQPLITARQLPVRARLDTLTWAAERWRAFHPASFFLGVELFHRGPLLGSRRGAAEGWLLNARDVYPSFAPTSEVLAWIRIADGRRAAADSALQAIRPDRSATPDPLATSMQALLHAAYAFRFDPASADGLVDSLLGSGGIDMLDLAAGPRLLLAFEAPIGTWAVGSRLAGSDVAILARSGWVARILGFFALGQLDSARTATIEAVRSSREVPGVRSLSSRLLAAWILLDQDAPDDDVESVLSELRNTSRESANDSDERASASWLLHLLQREGAAANLELAAVPDDPRLRAVIDARRDAGAIGPAAALRRIAPLLERQTASAVTWQDGRFAEIDNIPDIFYRTVLNGLAAQWHTARNDRDAAIERLRWHEHFDQHVLPISRPTVQDIDWAFGTWARWTRAVLLDSLGQRTLACESYEVVARNWARGDSLFAERARTATERRRALSCS